MSWIEAHQSLARHRKTLAVVASLKVDRHKLIGHLVDLWWWGLDNADSSGLVGNVSPQALAEAAGWQMRDAERFVQAILAAGFLDVVEGGYVLHDWFDYAGKLYDQREVRKAANRESQRRRRQRLSASGQHDGAPNDNDKMLTKSDNQHSTGPDQPDQPPVGPLSATSPARARAPGEASPRRALESQTCQFCARTFIGPYSEHRCDVSRPPQRLGAVMRAGKRLSDSDRRAVESELAAAEQAKADRGPLELSPDLAAEDARLRALEQAVHAS